jgi:hypothetical protein
MITNHFELFEVCRQLNPVIKVVLAVLCYRISTPTMKALAADHRNDVVATVVALVFGIIGKRMHHHSMQHLFFSLASKAIDGEIKPKELSVIDPVGTYR